MLNPHKTIVTLIYDIKSHNYPTRHEVKLFGNQLICIVLSWDGQYVKIVNSINSSFEQSLALMKFHQICHFGFCLHSCDFCRSKIGNQAISSENQTGNRIYLVMLLAHRSPKESFHILYLLYMRPCIPVTKCLFKFTSQRCQLKRASNQFYKVGYTSIIHKYY